MHVIVKAGGQPQPIANYPKSCGKIGVLVQSLDSAGIVFVGTDQQSMAGPVDFNGNPPDGVLVGRSSAITNIPSVIPFVPFSGTLYARNVGAADSILAITAFQLE